MKFIVTVIFCLSAGAVSAEEPIKKGYAPVNGLKMYYEVYGTKTGTPLLLLHGAFSGIGTSFGELIPFLSKDRPVIAVEMQGHGRTADIDRAISCEALADDASALLKYLQVPSADVFGYSLGAGAALQLAIRHPENVHKLILTSVSYTVEGVFPELTAGMSQLTPAMLEGSPFKREYDSLAPRKQDFALLVDKLKTLNSKKQDWSAEDIKRIKAPALVMIGDADIIQPEHAVKMYKLLGGHGLGDMMGLPASQLAILPGTSHISIMHQRSLLSLIIPAFLDAAGTNTK
ncbi:MULTISPECIES: alpha/beta fold hydrolase [Niastella]|uniref:Alpha/beta hydrolase n=1 Tax=Niastella soli TaxID=2821487 RepID=A0ABS3Z0K4_9BACT|nr:alpha/beta hydrolase [Niastella soli]MBO9203701.1 alpha/beta hydrolase [Niastella soli]